MAATSAPIAATPAPAAEAAGSGAGEAGHPIHGPVVAIALRVEHIAVECEGVAWEQVLRMKDGLPKMKDLPKEMGGTGETVPE